MKYIKSLDGVRAIAIILVILFHFSSFDKAGIGIEIGWVGVQLFFVLSGFLITSILVEAKSYSFKHYLRRFYWRRSLRIFPLYFLYLFILAFIFIFLNQPQGFDEIFTYLFTYTFNYTHLWATFPYERAYTHLWSLSIEEQFYFFWPFIIYWLSKNSMKKLLIVLIVATPILRLLFAEVLLQNTNYDFDLIGQTIYRLTFCQIDSFAVGGLLIFILNGDVKINEKKFLIFTSLFIAILGIINLYSLWGTREIKITSLGYPIAILDNYMHVWSYSALNILFAAALLYIMRQYEDKGFLSNKWMVSIGKVSYGMYVYHFLVLVVIERFFNIVSLPKSLPVYLITLIVYIFFVYLVSFLSFKYFELFFLKFKNVKMKNIFSSRLNEEKVL